MAKKNEMSAELKIAKPDPGRIAKAMQDYVFVAKDEKHPSQRPEFALSEADRLRAIG